MKLTGDDQIRQLQVQIALETEAKISATTRIIELEARITELDKQLLDALKLVKQADDDRIKVFSVFLMTLTAREKESIKDSLIREFGLKS